MRKSMLILLLAWWLVAPTWGAELPREVRDALPAAAEEITEELEDPASLSEGLSRLWDRALGYVEEAVRQSIGGGVVLLAAAVLCALTEECMDAAGGKVHFVPMAGALAITLAAAGSVKTMMGLGQETVEELNTFSKALLPTLSAAVGLTTLHQDPFAMGVAAGHMVLDAIAGKSIEPAFVRPDTPLILRETTAPPAATAASAQA